MSIKASVLLSGGLDSCVTFAMAVNEFGAEHVQGISFDYGQRHSRELQSAADITSYYGSSHLVIRGLELPTSALTDASLDIPKISYNEIEGKSPAFVPFRNGTFISIAAAYAAAAGASYLYTGIHAEDAENWAYADCTPEFFGGMANAVYVGTYNQLRLRAPFLFSSKDRVVLEGYELGAPMRMSWSCYMGEELHCGTCPTCRARKEAFKRAGVIDPTHYAE